MKRRFTIVSLLIFAFSSSILCGKDMLTIGLIQPPNVLNPLISRSQTTGFVGNFLFSYFVRYDPDLKLVPDLITQIPTRKNGGISPDGLTYTYHLRKNVRWQDGQPLTSADVKFTYHLIMNPEVKVASREGWEEIKQVLTPDATTVIFKLKKPYIHFAADIFLEEPVLPKHLLQEKLKNFSGLAFQQHPVGSGPYRLKEWKHGSHIILTANEAYYRKVPAIKKVILKFSPNQDVRFAQLKAGEIDAVEGLQEPLVKRASEMKDVRLYKTPGLVYQHLTFNLEAELIQHPEIRRAIALSVNREEISEKIYSGIWEPAYSEFLKSSPFYNPEMEKILAYDPGKAKELLTKAGWVDKNGDGIREKKGQKLEVQLTTSQGRNLWVMTGEILQQQFKKTGIGIKIKNCPASDLFNLRGASTILGEGQFQMVLYTWSGSTDPSILENLYSEEYLPPAGWNYARIQNKKLTQLLKQGAATWEPAKRRKIYHDISRIVAEELPLLPLLRATKVDVYPAGLQNFRPNPTQIGNSWNCYQWKLVDRKKPARK